MVIWEKRLARTAGGLFITPHLPFDTIGNFDSTATYWICIHRDMAGLWVRKRKRT